MHPTTLRAAFATAAILAAGVIRPAPAASQADKLRPRTLLVTVNLNTATRDQLLAFTGIGAAYADKIIAARPFKMRSELVSRHIMPASEYLAIKAKLLPKAESSVEGEPATEPAPDPAGRLDLNRATREELLAMDGIGQAYADKIIQGRPYRERSDLVKRGILPGAAYAKIKERLVARQ